MEAAIYFLKAIICSGILFGYYLLFLKDKTFHHYNRFYLLLLVVVSMTLPLLKIEYFTIEFNDKVFLLLNKFQIFSDSKNTNDEINYLKFLAILLSIISVFLLSKLSVGIFKIFRFKNQFRKEQFEGINFYQTDLSEAPFSYFKNLFWKNSIALNSDIGKQILKHEMVHIEQKHSYDKVFMEIVTAVLWFNPVFHLIKKEIYLIHEYLADKKAVRQSDTKAFAQMLLASHFAGNQHPVTSPFLNSNLKKRLKMIQNPQTKFGYARRIFALPVLFTVAFAYMVNAKNKEIEKQNIEIETIAKVLQEDENYQSANDSDTLSTPEDYAVKDIDIFIFDGKKVSKEVFATKKKEFFNDKRYYFSVNENFLSKDLPVIFVGGRNRSVKRDDQIIGKIVASVWDTPPAEKINYELQKDEIPYEEQVKNADSRAIFVIDSELVSKENYLKYYLKNKDKKIGFSSKSHLQNDKDHWIFGERQVYGVFQAMDFEKMNKKNAEKFHQLVKKINPKWYYEQYINQKYTDRENERKRQAGEKENGAKVIVEEVKYSAAKRDYDKNPFTQTEIKELKAEAERLKTKSEKEFEVRKDNMIIFKFDEAISYVKNKDASITKDDGKNAPVKSSVMVLPLRDGEFFIDGKQFSKDELKQFMKGFEEEMFKKDIAVVKPPFKSVKMFRTAYGDKGFSRLDKVEFFTK